MTIKATTTSLTLSLTLSCTLVLLLPLFAAKVSASGLSGSTAGSRDAPREVDQVYEFGKAIYLGRTPDSKKTKYCVNVEGQPKKLRGRTLRSYKGAKQLDFANALVDCQQPDQLALLGIKKEEVAYVLYYLNKRFKLELDTGR